MSHKITKVLSIERKHTYVRMFRCIIDNVSKEISRDAHSNMTCVCIASSLMSTFSFDISLKYLTRSRKVV